MKSKHVMVLALVPDFRFRLKFNSMLHRDFSPLINIMTHEGYTAVISYDPDTEGFRFTIQGLNGGADFYGSNFALRL